MQNRIVFSLSLILNFSVFTGIVNAESFSLEDLNKSLTPLGAIKAANGDGSIPEWTGGITAPPAGYNIGDHHPDPYGDEKPLYTVDAKNMDQYADLLSPGQKAMLQQYNSFFMSVYPSHRSASYPQRIYDAAVSNAAKFKLADDGNGVEGSDSGVPFPVPQNGLQAIWNHLLRYRGDAAARYIGQAATTAGGSYTMVRYEDEFIFTFGNANPELRDTENRIFLFKQTITAPARLAGRILMAHETLNAIKEPRAVWVYNPGLRRVRRAPDVVYDSPPPGTDALRTVDQFDMFNGAPDRYDWELVGRKEMLVPYNSYQLHAKGISYDDILQPGHINSKYTRYEKHRVWVVEAKLKQDKRHIYSRRTFYIDEDSWQIVAIDQYDSNGKLWRVSEAHCINYYEVPVFWSTLEVHYDLQSRRYLAFGLNNNDKMYDFSIKRTAADFTPSSLRASGKR